MKKIRSILSLVLLILVSQSLYSQDDGPRQYWNSPKNTNVIQAYAWFIQSNAISPEGNIFSPDAISNGQSILFNYTRGFSVGGQSALFTTTLPLGNFTTDLDDNTTQSTRGVGDIYFQGVFNILGSPALDLESFMEFEQKTVLSLLAGLSLPTGNYDGNRLLNMGENRMAFRVGLPFVQTLSNWEPGKITTLEILPSAWFYSENNKFLGDISLKQKTLFMTEMHLTHDFTPDFFGSLDYLFQTGGETSMDDVNQDDSQNSSFLGATLGFMLNEQFQFAFRYTATLNPDLENDIDMDILQLNFTYAW